jgi:hypothetical protein
VTYISAARRWCELFCGRQFITATYRLTLDFFPSPIWLAPYGAAAMRPDDPLVGVHIFEPGTNAIRLPRPPLLAITSLQYYDTSGTLQTLDPTSYKVDTDSEPGRVNPADDLSWPAVREQIGAVIVTFTAGYGASASNVPENIRLAIMQLAGHWFQNRETVGVGNFGEVPMATKTLLNAVRVKEY